MTSKKNKARAPREANPKKFKKKTSVLVTDKVEFVDYKDVNLLQRFVSDRSKIRNRRVTGNDVQQQRDIAKAIKNAREMALLPYTKRVSQTACRPAAARWRGSPSSPRRRPRPPHPPRSRQPSRRSTPPPTRADDRRWRPDHEGHPPFRSAPASASAATSSKSPTATPATTCCPRASRCPPVEGAVNQAKADAPRPRPARRRRPRIGARPSPRRWSPR